MIGYRVLATVHLLSSEEGGLSAGLPSGTRSLLLRFVPVMKDVEPIVIGAVLTPRGTSQLVPGAELEAEIGFWADEAEIYATPDAPFELWYGRRIVGYGLIKKV